MIDLSNAQIINNKFGGSEKKCTIIYDNRIYMIKFPDPIREKNNDLSYMNNVFSEDIGCKILKSMGFDVQNTFLAKYKFNNKEKTVVACEDFCQDGAILSEFSKLILSDFDSPRTIKTNISIENVMGIIENMRGNEDKNIFKDKFWDLFVADTLIGNQDRHADNWGFLNKNGKVEFAPIYDCGSALSPLLSDKILLSALKDENVLKDVEYNLSSPYSYQGKKIFFVDFYKNPPSELQRAVKRIVPRISMGKVEKIVNTTENLSDLRKKYIIVSVKYRYQNILAKTLKIILNKEQKLQRKLNLSQIRR